MAMAPIRGLYDEHLSQLVERLAIAGQVEETTYVDIVPSENEVLSRDHAYDWQSIYSSDSSLTANYPSEFLGAVGVSSFPGRGLGLVTLRDVKAGELLLVEKAWALSAEPSGSGTHRGLGGDGGLLEACALRVSEAEADSLAPAMLRALWKCGVSDDHDMQIQRKRLFCAYLSGLRGDARTQCHATLAGLSSDALSADILNEILLANARRTEIWDPWTMLLDEASARGGLWLAASLFNHSCVANVTLSYGGVSARDLLVVRAAMPLRAGIELVHSYVYPFETVEERAARFSKVYKFQCCCQRCTVEGPFAKEAIALADDLQQVVAAFTTARRVAHNMQSGCNGRAALATAVKDLRCIVDRVDAMSQKLFKARPSQLSVDQSELWRAQFVWGDQALSMGNEAIGDFSSAAAGYARCVRLVSLIAPCSGYELKFRATLMQCHVRRMLSGDRGASPDALKDAMRATEVAHDRIYGGAGRHFLVRMQKRLQEAQMALRTRK